MKQLIFIALCSCSFLLKGQDIANLEASLPTKDLRVDSVFALLRAQHSIVFSYSNSLKTATVVHFDKTTLTVLEIIKTLASQTEMNYKLQGRKILLFSKKKKHFVNGIIKDNANGEILPGTSVRLKGTNYGVSADEKGFYQLRIEEGNYTLSFSSIGFEIEDKEISVFGETELNVSLKISTSPIDEVKVTKQRNFWRNLDVGRNISTLDSKKIETLNTNNAADILQASMPGVWSTQSSGAPGDHQKVKIRGINSIFGCTDPLYIIDGVAVPIVNLHSLGIADLNIHDIESITVLKDASSNAIYGYQGGNGVIIVDTKRGGESHISFSTKMGIQRVPRKLNLMSSKDFLTSMDSAKKNHVDLIRIYYPEYQDTLKNTDWQNELFQDGILNEYQLSGSGKIGKTSFYLSGNYYTHQGIINTSTYKRYNATANFGRNITKKLSAEINIRSSLQKNTNNLDTYNGNDLILKGINYAPMFKSLADSFYYYPRSPIYKRNNLIELPSIISNRNYYMYSLISLYPYSKIPIDSILHSNSNTLDVQSNTFDLRLKYFIMDNLYANAASSLSLRNNLYQSDIRVEPDTNYMKSNEHYILFNQQININYQKYLNEHEILITSGYRNYADNAYWKLDSITKRDHTENIYLKNSLALNADHGAVIRQIQSFSALLNYNYSKKYFLSLVANYETLTVNRSYNITALYPSASISWDLSHEFLINRLTWLNECSIFANWGRVGNMPLNALSEDVYSKTRYRYTYNDTDMYGSAITQLANHNLKPEMITEYNVGFNIGFLNNRIRFMADYYYKTSDDLIAIRDIPYYYNSGRMIYNIGKLVNEGKEFSFDVDVVSSMNFKWTSSFAISTNMLRVKKITDVSELQFYNSDILIPDFEVKENQELGVIKGYQFIGRWTTEDSLKKVKSFINSRGSKFYKPDSVHLKFSDKDQVVLGKSMPDYTWHWQNTLEYRNFTLEILWYGVKGVSKFNATKVSTFMAGTSQEVNNFMQSRNTTLSDSIFYQSSYFVEDASFIRLKQLTIAYNFPKKMFNKANVRLSLSFDNFFTITKYTGYDPEATIYTDNSFSDYAVDRGAYPNPKSVYLTLNMDF
jgi:TonB-linked SusC/RagA family outer membrane protein